MHPDPPPPKIRGGKTIHYAAWIACKDCGKSYAITTQSWNRLKANGGKDRPRCPACKYQRNQVKKEIGRMKTRFIREAALAGIPKDRMPSVRLRKAPASGVPRYNPILKAWYIPYFFKSDKFKDQRMVVLEAATEEQAVEEARDWYVRALMHGATWLPDDFTADRPWNDDTQAVIRRLRMIWNKAKRKQPIKESIQRYAVKVTQYRYKAIVNNTVVARGLRSRKEATEAVRKANPLEKVLDPKPKKCKWCGQLPVGDGRALMHVSVDCANVTGIKTRNISWRFKVAIWNEILRFGTFAGNDDFQREHVMLVGWHCVKGMLPFEPPAEEVADPLEGFEI
jgi:hypothetical protein